MSEVSEPLPAPAIFATDCHSIEMIDGVCVRFTYVEEIRGERRIVGYLTMPIPAWMRLRADIVGWLANNAGEIYVPDMRTH